MKKKQYTKQELYDKLSKLLVETSEEFKEKKARDFCDEHGLVWERVKRKADPLRISKTLTRRLPQLPFEQPSA